MNPLPRDTQSTLIKKKGGLVQKGTCIGIRMEICFGRIMN